MGSIPRHQSDGLDGAATATEDESHRPLQHLDCLEVLGGSSGMDSCVRVTGLDVWTWSQPADTVAGGDLYLVSMCACAEVSRFLVADVTGHNAKAAEVAARLRKLMRKHINKPDQTLLACALNRDFDGMAIHGKFATAVLATFFPPTGHLIVCNAGHPRPLWYQARKNQWAMLDAHDQVDIENVYNLPFGVTTDAPYAQFAIQLERNDLVLIYTDGLVEAKHRSGRLLGEAGLLELVRRIPVNQQHNLFTALRTEFDLLTCGIGTEDDATMLLIRANGEQPPHQSIAQKIRVTAKMFGLLSTRR